MRMHRLTTTATFTGALIGAGFASGREIALYFAHTSIITPLLAGVFLGFFCYFFLELGRQYQGDISLFLDKGSKVFIFIVRLCCVITTCAMVAASEDVVYKLFDFSGGGIITGILALLTVYWGVEKIKITNFFIVPIIIVLIAVLFYYKHDFELDKPVRILPAFTYCTMNIITGGYFVSTFSANYTKKDNAVIGIASGGILMVLLSLIYIIIQKNIYADMPLMQTAEQLGFAKIGNVIMYLAIFTTITSSLSVAGDNKKIPCLVITALSFVISIIGFSKIVDIFYPLMGIAGAIVTIICVLKAVFFDNKNKIRLQCWLKRNN